MSRTLYSNQKYSQYNAANVNLSVVALKCLILGMVLLISMSTVMLHILEFGCADSLMDRICVYLVFILIFHLLEFFSTCLWNNSQTDDDSFILGDFELHAVYVASILELVVESVFLPRQISLLQTLGILTALVGQICRTLAMFTAQESFNHYIQTEKDPKHKLVTTGIYHYLRHPSYFGFFWWFVGTQLWLGNILVLAVGAFKLQKFFKRRIEYEEKLLVQFYGVDYIKYKSSTIIGLPFVSNFNRNT